MKTSPNPPSLQEVASFLVDADNPSTALEYALLPVTEIPTLAITMKEDGSISYRGLDVRNTGNFAIDVHNLVSVNHRPSDQYFDLSTVKPVDLVRIKRVGYYIYTFGNQALLGTPQIIADPEVPKGLINDFLRNPGIELDNSKYLVKYTQDVIRIIWLGDRQENPTDKNPSILRLEVLQKQIENKFGIQGSELENPIKSNLGWEATIKFIVGCYEVRVPIFCSDNGCNMAGALEKEITVPYVSSANPNITGYRFLGTAREYIVAKHLESEINARLRYPQQPL